MFVEGRVGVKEGWKGDIACSEWQSGDVIMNEDRMTELF